MWWETTDGYVNVGAVTRIRFGPDGTGVFFVVAEAGGSEQTLKGQYATEAEAREVIRLLLSQTIDPTTITGGATP